MPQKLTHGKNFLQTFKNKYMTYDIQTLYKQVHDMKQGICEPTVDFVIKFQNLSRPLNMTESQLMPILQQNMLPTLKPEIIRSRPQTFKELIEAGKLAETIQQASESLNALTVNAMQPSQPSFQSPHKQNMAPQYHEPSYYTPPQQFSQQPHFNQQNSTKSQQQQTFTNQYNNGSRKFQKPKFRNNAFHIAAQQAVYNSYSDKYTYMAQMEQKSTTNGSGSPCVVCGRPNHQLFYCFVFQEIMSNWPSQPNSSSQVHYGSQ